MEELLKDGSAGDNPQLTADMRLVGAELVDLLINESPAEDQEQIARSMSLVTNLDRIADSLDQASPAMFAVETPTEPQGQKVLSLSPLEQGRKWRRNFRKVLPKKLRKYF